MFSYILTRLTEWATVVWAHIDRIEQRVCHHSVDFGRECVEISFRADCTVGHVDSGWSNPIQALGRLVLTDRRSVLALHEVF